MGETKIKNQQCSHFINVQPSLNSKHNLLFLNISLLKLYDHLFSYHAVVKTFFHHLLSHFTNFVLNCLPLFFLPVITFYLLHNYFPLPSFLYSCPLKKVPLTLLLITWTLKAYLIISIPNLPSSPLFPDHGFAKTFFITSSPNHMVAKTFHNLFSYVWAAKTSFITSSPNHLDLNNFFITSFH